MSRFLLRAGDKPDLQGDTWNLRLATIVARLATGPRIAQSLEDLILRTYFMLSRIPVCA
jgi:hypothetical protein